MSSLQKYCIDVVDLENQIKYLNDCAEINDKRDFVAARKIQAWYRGIITRNHIRNLNTMALIIQRNWRGYRCRIYAKQYLIQRVNEMWNFHYNRSAVLVQAAWRGYWLRKNSGSIRKVKEWCQNVKDKNGEILKCMSNFRQSEITDIENRKEQESLLWILFILFKLHYLLRTKRIPGVITKLDSTQFTLIEKMIRCFEYKLSRRKNKF